MRLLRRLLGAWHWSPWRVAWSVPLVAFGTWGLVNALRADAFLGALFVFLCGLAGLLGPDRGAGPWRRLAEAAGLTFFPRSLTRGRSIAGTMGEQRVVLVEDALKRNRATLVVSGRIPDGFTLHPRTLLGGIAGSGMRTGDDALDETVTLRGDAAAALAAVGNALHRKAFRLRLESKPAVEVSHGAVRMTLKPGPDGSRIEAAFALARDLASALSCGTDDEDIARALLSSVRHDPQAEFRRECLHALGARYPEREETLLARNAARQDADDLVALDAAGALGAESLKQYARERRHDPALAMKAVRKLAGSIDDATLLELVGDALRSPLPGAMRTAAPIPAIDAMIVFDQLKDGSRSAPSYLAALENPDEGIRLIAARNLKSVGGADAVEPLRRLVERHPGGKDAKEALATMRELGEGREGELSLGEPDAEGDLSIAGESNGELSLAEKQRFDTLRRKS